MKYQVSASDYTELSDDQKAMYGSEKDGNHTIKIEGMPPQEDVSGLKAKVEQLLTEAKQAKADKKKAEKDAAQVAADAAQQSGDVEAINKSWQKKYDDALAESNGAKDDALNMLRHEKVHSQAVELATTLAVPGSADVLLPHIESRLSMDFKDGRAVAVVKDTAGQPSALTVEELGKEIAANAAFAPLIVASNAAGGGANGQHSNGGAAQIKTTTQSTFDSWTPAQRMEFSKGRGQIIEP